MHHILSLFMFVALLPNSSATEDSNAVAQGSAAANSRVHRLVSAALEQTRVTIYYDPSYRRIPYPGGDVPLDRGVCTDVVVRAFRKIGIDLQKEIHEDMQRNKVSYPKLWGLSKLDSNIDHRRVPNQMTYFRRHCDVRSNSIRNGDYLPGDVVAWRLTSGLLHIGIVTDTQSSSSGSRLVVHNIGAGAKLEDVLFAWTVIGHYRCL